MNIGFMGICILVILLCVPVYLIYFYKLNLQRKFALALAKVVGYLALTGIMLEFVFRMNNIALNILWVVLLALLTSVVTVNRARLTMKSYFIPAFISTLVVTFCIGVLVVLAAFSTENPFDTRYLIPVTGFILGGIMESNCKALETYYAGLRNHNALFYYLLGNGASHNQAVRYFVKRALERSMIPSLGRMAYIIIGVTPMVMWAMLLAGSDVYSAVLMQLLTFAMVLAASPLALLLTLMLAKRYAFDEYGKLKSQEKVNKAEA